MIIHTIVTGVIYLLSIIFIIYIYNSKIDELEDKVRLFEIDKRGKYKIIKNKFTGRKSKKDNEEIETGSAWNE